MKARLPKGYGKQNVNELMRQAQQMQDKMQEKQAELEETEFTGKSGGDMVEVTLRGDYTVTAVKIKPETVEELDMEMLEDLVGAAFNEAVRTVKETSERELGGISDGLNLPDFGF